MNVINHFQNERHQLKNLLYYSCISDLLAIAQIAEDGFVAYSEQDYMNAKEKIILLYNSSTIPDNSEIYFIVIYNTNLRSIPDFLNLPTCVISGSDLNCLPEYMILKSFIILPNKTYPKWLPYDKLVSVSNF